MDIKGKNKMDEIINNVTDTVIKGVNPSWNKLQKIRFVYLELGKYLEKNTSFFLNEKLDNFSLSKEEMNDIYFNDKLNISEREHSINQYQIICKSAAAFLKNAYDKLGIYSEFVHTIGDTNNIRHWFIVAVDDDNNQYFLTLAADLPYIKNNLPTCHFASNISFFGRDDNPNYEIDDESKLETVRVAHRDNNGNFLLGHEIKHTVLVNDDKLKDIDYSIGYSRLYEAIETISDKNFFELFWVLAEENSEIFKIYRRCFNIDEESSNKIDEIEDEQVLKFKEELNAFVLRYLVKNTDIDFNFVDGVEESIKSFVIGVLNKIKVEDIDYNLSVMDLVRKYKKDIKNTKYDDVVGMIKSVITIENRFDKYISLKNEYKVLESEFDTREFKNKDEIYELQRDLFNIDSELDKVKKSLSIQKLNLMLDKLAYFFLKDKLTIRNDKYVPVEYIVNKFELMLPVVFDFNYNGNNKARWTSFSIQGYSEQIVIIKQMLGKIFSELSEDNCKDIEDYSFRYTPVENRIKTYPLRDKDTFEYCIGFQFGCKLFENTNQYIYIPSSNLLRKSDPIKDNSKYFVVSERFNDELNKIEDIENYDEDTNYFRK